MRTIEQTIYSFDELDEKARERAREQWRDVADSEPAWASESEESIRAFCRKFGVDLLSFYVYPFGHYEFKTNASNDAFRGVTLKRAKELRDAMPTGYCLDSTLFNVFADEFASTGSAFVAFNNALVAAFEEWRADMEYQLSDECVDENIRCNGWEFFENGKLYREEK